MNISRGETIRLLNSVRTKARNSDIHELNLGTSGGPVVKTSTSNARQCRSIPGQELKSHRPHGQKVKT